MRIRRPKHALEQMKQKFEDKGCELLESEYRGSRQPLKYRCSCGKIRSMTYNNWYRYWKCCCNKEIIGKKVIAERESLFDRQDVCDIFKLSYDTIYDHIEKYVPPQNTHKYKCKKYYTEKDIADIASVLKGLFNV